MIPAQFFILFGLVLVIKFFPNTIISITNSVRSGFSSLTGTTQAATEVGQKLSANTVKTTKTLAGLAPIALKILAVTLAIYGLAVIGLFTVGFVKAAVALGAAFIAALAVWPEKIANFSLTSTDPDGEEYVDLNQDGKSAAHDSDTDIPLTNFWIFGAVWDKLFGGKK